jgi:hypothetical protein
MVSKEVMTMKWTPASLASLLIACALLAGCNQTPKDTSFTSKPGLKLNLPAAQDSAAADSAKKAATDPSKMFGFSVKVEGAAEVHFYNGSERHTGPATAEEYLPVIEMALNNPSLHPQERASLENMKARMQATGSAGEFAVTRRIPNLKFTMKGTATEAEFTGGDELVMKVKPTAVDQIRITLKVWNNRQVKQCVYNVMAGTGQSGEMNVSSTMEDFTLSWDSGSGKLDKEIEPSGADSQAVKGK